MSAVLLSPKMSDRVRSRLTEMLTRAAAADGWRQACEAALEVSLGDAEEDIHPWQVFALGAQLATDPLEQIELRYEALFMLRSVHLQRFELDQFRKAHACTPGGKSEVKE
jgi:hypothetical protein